MSLAILYLNFYDFVTKTPHYYCWAKVANESEILAIIFCYRV